MRQVRAWKCQVCGYVHSGDKPPDGCPVCGVGGDLFEPFEFATGEEQAAEERPAPAAEAHVVVVGGGVAGVKAADEARRLASGAHITLITREPGVPILRLNLTRLLAGEVSEAELELHPAAWYEKKRIELRHAEVTGIDRQGRSLTLGDGSRVPYDRLILACGAEPFLPPIPGLTRPNVFALRSLADARAILAAMGQGTRVACIGGGLLGLEAAGALARRGAGVTVLEGAPWLMPRQLAQPAGALLARHLEQHGVAVRCGVRVQEVTAAKDPGAGLAVRLADGDQIPADVVVVGAGIRPNLALARAAGLAINLGVVVDDRLVTSDPAILAAGDVAEHQGAVWGIWPVSYAQGVVAGANAAGARLTYRPQAPSNTLKVVGVDVFSAGQFEPAPGSFRVFEHQEGGRYWRLVAHEGRLVGANLFGDAALAPALKEAIDKATSLREAIDLLGSFPGAARAFVLEPALETTRRITKPASKEAIMASVKGTRTEKNLLAAFAGESQARNRYTYAGKAARKAGFVQIAALFEETARNEAEHAKRFFRFLEGGMVEITAMYPAGVIGDTAANLEAAANGEHEEWSQLYPEFARVAREEGFPEVAAAFITIARAEKAHEERFRRLLANVREDKVFRKDQPVKWKCDNCGYVHEGLEAPEKCPACLHPRDHFEVLAENY